jgi:hypothetical protein
LLGDTLSVGPDDLAIAPPGATRAVESVAATNRVRIDRIKGLLL